jgi:hypothetical protein
MYPYVRVAFVLLFVALALGVAALAGPIVSRNLAVRRSWRRTQATVFGMAAEDSVEVALGGQADDPRFNVPVDHKIGLLFLKAVPVYVDPADPTRMTMGGLLQMWLWPAGLAGAALLFLGGALAVASATHIGGWMFTPAPPPLLTDIRVFRPASEWKAPLVWSLLGVAAIACSIWIRTGTRIHHLGVGSIGLLFVLLMWSLSLDNATTEISADASALRKTTAFGWRQVPWEQVGAVEERTMVFGRGKSLLRGGKDYSFPGNQSTALVFADAGGSTLISASAKMQPRESMRQLLDLCASRTGHRTERRTTYDRNF